MSRTRFYDLQAEEEAKIREAERQHQQALTLKELAAIREATQSLCALMMGMAVRS